MVGKASELVGLVETVRVVYEPALVCKLSNIRKKGREGVTWAGVEEGVVVDRVCRGYVLGDVLRCRFGQQTDFSLFRL